MSYSGPRFDPDFSAESPGHLVLQALVTEAFSDPRVSEVDLLVGDSRYKREWATSSYAAMKVRGASIGTLHRLHRGATDQMLPMLRRARRWVGHRADSDSGPTSSGPNWP